ncbi:MAG: thioredoxin [Flavobacteriaceae bacterium]|nr:thioredoxin [Flavobacteriaceae bacterium]|tara:strand:+ start:195 stop:698 length:504 start_codon:yes stop_codon:yes gene_type:complete
MKKSIFLISLFLLGCSLNEKYTNSEGVVDIDYLFNSPNTEWFKNNYDSYKIDTNTLNNDYSNIYEYEIEIYMNTRCHDSEREVPRMIKILNQLNFSEENLKIILLNSEKKSSDGYEKGKNITNTPTIIFSKNSIEKNRIVEFPYENLEKDILKIINNVEYKHVYYSE